MGILSNLFGSRKKEYRRGLQDAMNAYEAFGNKQEKALNKIREEVRDGNKRMEDMLNAFGEDINGIYDYLTDQEKAALYNLCTPKDVNTLDEAEKRVLIAILYQLIGLESEYIISDYQRKYIRSIQTYLGITNPQMEIDLQIIENIDSNDVQKAMLQVVLEFLYLQNVKSLSDEQEEFLSYFSLNQRQAKQIEEYVIKLYRAVGEEGLCEKYGFEMQKEDSKTVSIKEMKINTCPNCKKENYLENDFCAYCGTKFNENALKFTRDFWDDDFELDEEPQTEGIERISVPSDFREVAKYDSNRMVFGRWEDKDILWRIVCRENRKILIVSEYLYNLGTYTKDKMNCFWEDSELRRKLNREFIDNAFSDNERNRICNTILKNEDQVMYDSDKVGYENKLTGRTSDKVFILTFNELKKYFPDIDGVDRRKILKAYDLEGYERNWWLRQISKREKKDDYFLGFYTEGDKTPFAYDVGYVNVAGGEYIGGAYRFMERDDDPNSSIHEIRKGWDIEEAKKHCFDTYNIYTRIAMWIEE